MLFDQFRDKYAQEDVKGMDALIERCGVCKGGHIQKSDWDLMQVEEKPCGSDAHAHSGELGVTTVRTVEDEACYWRKCFFDLQAEYQQRQKGWAAEDKETAVTEALLRQELEMKNSSLEGTLSSVQNEVANLTSENASLFNSFESIESSLRSYIHENEKLE